MERKKSRPISRILSACPVMSNWDDHPSRSAITYRLKQLPRTKLLEKILNIEHTDMVNFIIFVIDERNNPAPADEIHTIDAFNEKLQSNGFLVTAAGISTPENSTMIDNRNGASLSSPGSLFNEIEHYSGFWIIKDVNPEEAHVLALEGSMACNRRVELRPYLIQ